MISGVVTLVVLCWITTFIGIDRHGPGGPRLNGIREAILLALHSARSNSGAIPPSKSDPLCRAPHVSAGRGLRGDPSRVPTVRIDPLDRVVAQLLEAVKGGPGSPGPGPPKAAKRCRTGVEPA